LVEQFSKDSHDLFLLWFFLVFGLALSIKIAIYPQVMPNIVKDESKLDSATAYNQSIDHLFTTLALTAVGFFHPMYGFHGACILMVALSLAAVFFYVKLYRFDKEKKGSLLDLKPLGQQKSYIDFRRVKAGGPKLYNTEDNPISHSPLLEYPINHLLLPGT
jgi:cytochrome bd-type quinol oxidase subunit 2